MELLSEKLLQSENDSNMVKLFCALVGVAGHAFPVDIDEDDTVDDLKDAIKKKKSNTITCDARELDLYLATKDKQWLGDDDPTALQLKKGVVDEDIQAMVQGDQVKPTKTLKHWLFDKSKMPEPSTRQIHVLVVLPTKPDEPPSKKAKTVTAIKDEDLELIRKNLDIDKWHVGGISLGIERVESDFPELFYVRQESLDIFKVFKDAIETKVPKRGYQVVFVGTPGVGKSMLVVVFAFYMALCQNKRVILFRKIKGRKEGFSMLYLDPANKKSWRKDRVEMADLSLDLVRGAELCLDGFTQVDIRANRGTLEGFRLLATSAQFTLKDHHLPVLRRCLVPFWSQSDLNRIGEQLGFSKETIKEKYFYSGGNLCDFLEETEDVEIFITAALDEVDLDVAKLLDTRYGATSKSQVDRLRMTGIQAQASPDLKMQYMNSGNWFRKVTSEFALRHLGKFVEASFYETLWSQGSMLGDDALMSIAFENYIHTLAREGKKIVLQVREYDQPKPTQQTYFPVEFQAKSWSNTGRNETECDTAMKTMASSDIDYWYPVSRSLVTIDCVAKLNMPKQSDVVALIQITKSGSHDINASVLDTYAQIFPDRSTYIALVPDKTTCDAFRLDPVDPPTKVPLFVAYLPSWRS